MTIVILILFSIYGLLSIARLFCMVKLFDLKRVKKIEPNQKKIDIVVPCFRIVRDIHIAKRLIDSASKFKNIRLLFVISEMDTETSSILSDIITPDCTIARSGLNKHDKAYLLNFSKNYIRNDSEYIVTLDQDTILDIEKLLLFDENFRGIYQIPCVTYAESSSVILNAESIMATRWRFTHEILQHFIYKYFRIPFYMTGTSLVFDRNTFLISVFTFPAEDISLGLWASRQSVNVKTHEAVVAYTKLDDTFQKMIKKQGTWFEAIVLAYCSDEKTWKLQFLFSIEHLLEWLIGPLFFLYAAFNSLDLFFLMCAIYVIVIIVPGIVFYQKVQESSANKIFLFLCLPFRSIWRSFAAWVACKGVVECLIQKKSYR